MSTDLNDINKTDIEAIDRTVQLLYHYRLIQKDVWRITGLVHENPELFGVRPGGSCMEAAADFLEKVCKQEGKQ